MGGAAVTPTGLAALACLVSQNTALVLLMRMAVTNGSGFIASTAVCCDEAMKITVCTLVMIGYYVYKAPAQDAHLLPMEVFVSSPPTKSFRGLLRFISREVFGQSTIDILKMAVPALCYTMQKNCLYVALRHLEAAPYQVIYQAKILTTALFSCTLLNKPMSYKQVLALVVLMTGVSMVQVSGLKNHEKADHSPNSDGEQKPFLGLCAVAFACVTSGFASVYFELVLKTPSFSHSGVSEQLAKEFSMWVRNIHLAMFALVIAIVGAFLQNGDKIMEGGFLQGYRPITWLVIALEATGGIVVAVVIKYTDNILKNFGTAISIVTSTLVSSAVMGFSVTPSFVLGTTLVLFAVALYQRNPPTKETTFKGGCSNPTEDRSG